jgi:hypothetical protein
MKRILIRATAVALGLAIWGMAKADGYNSHLTAPGRIGRDQIAHTNQDAPRCLDLGRFGAWDDLRSYDNNDAEPFDYWRFNYDKNDLPPFDLHRDDLRYFDLQSPRPPDLMSAFENRHVHEQHRNTLRLSPI